LILTDREIQSSIKSGQIVIDPAPPIEAYSSTSLDLTLDEPADVWMKLSGQPIRPGSAGYSFNQLKHRKERISLRGYEFKPNTFLLAWTRETVHLLNTSRFAARVEGKSGIARLGIAVHLTAPTIHAGFKGPIQLEMYNFGPNDIILDVGMSICQLIFEVTFGTPAKGYAGAFFEQAAV
jgi:dCTP deaminase